MAKQKWQDKYKGRTSGMIIDPYLKNGYLDEYDFLQGIVCKAPQERYDDFVRACSFVLDPNSPFVKAYPDLDTRRKAVYSEVGYLGYEDKVFEVLLLLRVYHNSEWTLYCAEQNVFYELIIRANKPVEFEGMDEKKQLDAMVVKDKMMDTLDKLISRIDSRFKKMFMNDDSLIETAKNDVFRSPEDYAKNIKNAISN